MKRSTVLVAFLFPPCFRVIDCRRKFTRLLFANFHGYLSNERERATQRIAKICEVSDARKDLTEHPPRYYFASFK
ncbi:MAG: hypothetical protein C4334_06135 [Pyrinomonas sp.]